MARITQDAHEATRDAECVSRCIKRVRKENQEKAAKSKRKRKSCLLGFGIVTASVACATAALMTMSNVTLETWAARMVQATIKLK
jgi:hypothetical protein